VKSTPRVYFYCRDEEENLQEDVIALAEGFRELGVPYYANCDYWRQSTAPGDYLFLRSPDVAPDDCDIVVVSYTWPAWIRPRTYELVRRAWPDGLFRPGRRYRTVYMDSHDGHRTISWEPEFRQFDLILRAKLNRRAWHPANVRPWTLGLNNRILKATSGTLPYAERRRTLLWNFGASHSYPHGSRMLAERTFRPAIGCFFPIDESKDDLSVEPSDAYEALMWRQTGYRYSRSYYERLAASQAVACFCGEIIPPMPFRSPERYLVGGNRAKLRRIFYNLLSILDPRPPRSVQWDSFRFWESLSAGAVAFNLDLERYGVHVPVMPQNWVHYIGVNLESPASTIERLSSEWTRLPEIASAGRRWAMEYYSPRVMAARFLDECGFKL
jgi:hypothetical protein